MAPPVLPAGSKALVEFKAGRILKEGSTAKPDTRKGLVRILRVSNNNCCCATYVPGTVAAFAATPTAVHSTAMLTQQLLHCRLRMACCTWSGGAGRMKMGLGQSLMRLSFQRKQSGKRYFRQRTMSPQAPAAQRLMHGCWHRCMTRTLQHVYNATFNMPSVVINHPSFDGHCTCNCLQPDKAPPRVYVLKYKEQPDRDVWFW